MKSSQSHPGESGLSLDEMLSMYISHIEAKLSANWTRRSAQVAVEDMKRILDSCFVWCGGRTVNLAIRESCSHCQTISERQHLSTPSPSSCPPTLIQSANMCVTCFSVIASDHRKLFSGKNPTSVSLFFHQRVFEGATLLGKAHVRMHSSEAMQELDAHDGAWSGDDVDEEGPAVVVELATRASIDFLLDGGRRIEDAGMPDEVRQIGFRLGAP